MFSFTEMLRLLWYSVLGFFTGHQSLQPNQIAVLPEVVQESSGLAVLDSNSLFTMNDSGGENELFLFKRSGNLEKTIKIPNAKNVDWESLSFDKKGNIYIGDFGNNNNDRKDLKIYIYHSSSETTDIISYKYPDQESFPAPANFNMEGFFFFQDSLYLFSKNILPAGSGYTKVYSLPATAGDYTANLRDSIYTGTPVTGAAINDQGNLVVLLSYGKIIILSNFENSYFSSGKKYVKNIRVSQSEGIVFTGQYEILYSNENGKLFRIDMQRFIERKRSNNQQKP